MGITKFTSFIVFLFGGLLLLVVAATFVMRWIDLPLRTVSQAHTVPPSSDMTPLKVGSQEQFTQKLESLFETGGMEAVRSFVQKEMTPGRTIMVASTSPNESPTVMVLIDRELRRCDLEGAALVSSAPLLPRANAAAVMAEDVHLTPWRWLKVKEPFQINTWWVQRS